MAVKKVVKKDQKKNLELVLRAVSELYPFDRTSPGIVLSYLKNENFYVSLCRYSGSFGNGKMVLLNAQGDTIDTALAELISKWQGRKNAANELGVEAI